MGIYGFAITKSASFRGAAQQFTNVYYYEDSGSIPSDANLETMLDNLVTYEKDIHSSVITFVRGRVWTAGGTPSSNNMRVDKPLSGAGLTTHDADLDRERAVLVRLRAGNDSRGRPVYLRKWYHTCSSALGSAGAITGGVKANTAQIAQSSRDTFETAFDAGVTSRTVAGTVFTLCGPSGRNVTGSTEVHPYLEHHQLGDMWRGV